MEIHGATGKRQQQHDGGVKVKFIETQFVSSDAASFKAVVQRLTGRSAPSPPPPASPRPNRPRARAAVTTCPAGAGWAGHSGVGGSLMMATPVKQEARGGAGGPLPNLEELHELCDFGNLLYSSTVAGGARRVDGAGYGFPY